MKIIKFRRLNGKAPKTIIVGKNPETGEEQSIEIECWEIAFNENHLNKKLNGDMAEIIMPAKPVYIQLWRKIFPLKFIEIKV